jgi:hypothetical protein
MYGYGYAGHDCAAGILNYAADGTVEGLCAKKTAAREEKNEHEGQAGEEPFAATIGSADAGAHTGENKRNKGGAIHRDSEDFGIRSGGCRPGTIRLRTVPCAWRQAWGFSCDEETLTKRC